MFTHSKMILKLIKSLLDTLTVQHWFCGIWHSLWKYNWSWEKFHEMGDILDNEGNVDCLIFPLTVGFFNVFIHVWLTDSVGPTCRVLGTTHYPVVDTNRHTQLKRTGLMKIVMWHSRTGIAIIHVWKKKKLL